MVMVMMVVVVVRGGGCGGEESANLGQAATIGGVCSRTRCLGEMPSHDLSWYREGEDEREDSERSEELIDMTSIPR